MSLKKPQTYSSYINNTMGADNYVAQGTRGLIQYKDAILPV